MSKSARKLNLVPKESLGTELAKRALDNAHSTVSFSSLDLDGMNINFDDVAVHVVQVDIEKKRASRRLKERQQREQQLSPPSHQSPQHGRVVQSPSSSSGGQRTEEPLDSWV